MQSFLVDSVQVVVAGGQSVAVDAAVFVYPVHAAVAGLPPILSGAPLLPVSVPGYNQGKQIVLW